MEIGDEQHLAADVEVGGEEDVVDKAKVLAVEREVLQAGVGPVGDDERRLAARAIVEPLAVGRAHLASIDAGAAEGTYILRILVVLVEVIGAIAVADPEAAVRRKGDVGRAVGGKLAVRRPVAVRLRRRTDLLPDDFALEGRLDHLAGSVLAW